MGKSKVFCYELICRAKYDYGVEFLGNDFSTCFLNLMKLFRFGL